MSVSQAARLGRALPAYANTAGRAVHVKIQPQPRNLAESTEVLRVLRQYGEVVMYKNLRHEPNLLAANTALAIYQNTTSAQNVIDASPLRFELQTSDVNLNSPHYHGSSQVPAKKEKTEDSWAEGEQLSSENSHEKQEWSGSLVKDKNVSREHIAGDASPTGPNDRDQGRDNDWAQANPIPTQGSQPPKPFSPNPTPSSTSATSLPLPRSSSSATARSHKAGNKEFHLTVIPSVLNHQAYIQRQHYYGGFRVDDKTMMAEDLEARVPVKGLVDCQIDKGEVPLRMRQRRDDVKGVPRKTLGEIWREAMSKKEKSGRKEIRLKFGNGEPTTGASEGDQR